MPPKSEVHQETLFRDEELQQFHREGYVIVRQLADLALCEHIREVTYEGLAREIPPIEYEAEVKYPGAPESIEAAGGKTIRRLKQAATRHAVFLEWINAHGVQQRLKQLLGPQVVMPMAHHNCVMTKHPMYSSQTGWHQDVRYWSFETEELISVWLALDVEVEENGCLWLIPGSHRMCFSDEQFDRARFFKEDHSANQELIEQKIPAELQPGDALFFHAKTLHAAGWNRTESPKFSAVFTFRSIDNPPISGTRSASLPELLFLS